MNSNFDDISDKVHELKSGYETLRRENEQFKQVADLQFNNDRLDGNMKRKKPKNPSTWAPFRYWAES